MKTIEKSTGTRHVIAETIVEEEHEVPDGEGHLVVETHGNYVTECGRKAYGKAEESEYLKDFPEDFGDLPEDCGLCERSLEGDS